MADEAEVLPGATRRSLERIALRLRESTVTTSGWRLEIDSSKGEGAIVRAERGHQCFYRGEGVCLGLKQTELEKLYQSLLPSESSGGDNPQLG